MSTMVRLLTILAITSLGIATKANGAETCDGLVALKLPDTTITAAQLVAAGDFKYEAVPGITPTVKLPARCRVTGSIKPTADSDIRFEVWLPTSGWNHRFQQGGNGGLAGAMFYASMIDALQRGSATAGTDDGHQRKGENPFDSSWIPGHPEKLIDYGYRAVHLTAVAAQTIVQAYYGQKAAHSYFLGCSDGGRESLTEAQRYPEDFDGYLAGGAGDGLLYNGVRGIHELRTLHNLGPEQAITPMQLEALSATVLQRCDALDGVRDGVLRDPRECDFKARELICESTPDGRCLTAPQADAVQRIYDGFKDPATGKQLAEGAFGTMGAEHVMWRNLIEAAPLGDAADIEVLATLVYGNPEAPLDLVKVANDIRTATVTSLVSANDPDLRAARRLGRKIIQWHGWADPNTLPQYAVAYSDAVHKVLGTDTADTYRLFMAPGMAHCKGGIGPTLFGGVFGGPTHRNGFADTSGAAGDPEHDIVSALERWVEQDVAPERIIVSDYVAPTSDADGAAPILGGAKVKSTRPLCPYPKVALYKGAGSTDDAANFRCGMP